MMDKNFLPPEDRELAEQLETLTERVKPNAAFERELEKRLMQTQSPEPKAKGYFARAMPALGLALGLIMLALVLTRILRTMPPQPGAGNTPAPQETLPPPQEALPTPEPTDVTAYTHNGAPLKMEASLPEGVSEASVYTYRSEQPATLESARAFAARFGMNGKVYQTVGELPGTEDFLIVDGNQWLHVRSDQYFQYYPDYSRHVAAVNGGNPPADYEARIEQFLQSYGFDFPHQIVPSEMYGGILVEALTPDGHPICYEYFDCAGLRFTLDDQGILMVDGNLPNYDLVGQQYGIISAEEAFQLIVHPEQAATDFGVLEGQNSVGQPINTWLRPRPLDQTITLYGWLSSISSLEGGAPLVTLDGYTATGNIADVPAALENTFVEATGQFHEADGVRTFELETWKIYDGIEDSLTGTIQRQGDQATLVTEDGGSWLLPDVPPDLPLPLENAFVIGVRVGETFDWKSIDLRNVQGGGGGGGGGNPFYKLNLTGTPVSFPTPAPIPTHVEGSGGGASIEAYLVQPGDTINSIAAANGITPEELMQLNGMTDPSQLVVGQTLNIQVQGATLPQTVEALRGIISTTIYKQTDGSQRTEYGFITNGPFPYMLLQGDNLDALKANQNRPLDVWGTMEIGKDGQVILKVDRYEIPFPDLKFQIMKGIEKSTDLNGQTVLLFTDENGDTYVELAPNCYDLIGAESVAGTGRENEPILLETLAVPGLTFKEHPALCVFSSMTIGAKSSQPQELTVTADQVNIAEEPPVSAPPTVTIKHVQLVYYMANPRYLAAPLDTDQRYLQPAWLFTGHYSNGDIFFILIQALKQEFLLPDTAPYTPPG